MTMDNTQLKNLAEAIGTSVVPTTLLICMTVVLKTVVRIANATVLAIGVSAREYGIF